jgi:hypothetical protein
MFDPGNNHRFAYRRRSLVPVKFTVPVRIANSFEHISSSNQQRSPASMATTNQFVDDSSCQ